MCSIRGSRKINVHCTVKLYLVQNRRYKLYCRMVNGIKSCETADYTQSSQLLSSHKNILDFLIGLIFQAERKEWAQTPGLPPVLFFVDTLNIAPAPTLHKEGLREKSNSTAYMDVALLSECQLNRVPYLGRPRQSCFLLLSGNLSFNPALSTINSFVMKALVKTTDTSRPRCRSKPQQNWGQSSEGGADVSLINYSCFATQEWKPIWTQ